MDPYLRQELEDIQTKAFGMLGRDAIRSAIDAKAFAMPREMAASLSDEDIQRIYPEHIYDLPSLGARMRKPVRTKFDREIFLQRFWNLEELCHVYFSHLHPRGRLPIRLATLPLAQINGVCFFTSGTGERVVMLNEGVLFVAPELLSCLFEMRQVRALIERASAGDDDWVIPESRRLNEVAFQPFIQTLLMATSGALTIPQLADMARQGSRNALRVQTKDHWKITDDLERVVAHDSGNDDWRRTTPPNAALQYWACRGMFAVILGHEFSHFYRDHHRIRAARICLRSSEEMAFAVEQLRTYFGEPDAESRFGNPEFFATAQPTEIEADIDGFLCAARFAADNALSGEALDSLALGCAGAFWIMDWIERIQLAAELEFETAQAILEMPFTIRDAVLGHEHPCPDSRIREALTALAACSDHLEFARAVSRAWDDLVAAMEWVWANSAEQFAATISQSGTVLGGCPSRAGLFENRLAVGCFDS